MTKVLPVVGLALALSGGLSVAETEAQTRPCAPREQVIERLASAYGETRRAMGLGSNNMVIEVFASAETGSWTITLTEVSGLTCLIASGQAYETLAETLPKPDKGT